MIASNADLYAHLRALVEDLRQAGEQRWGTDLANAMAISGHAGEVLGQIRQVLRRLRRSDTAQQLRLQQRIDEMLQALDKALGLPPMGWD